MLVSADRPFIPEASFVIEVDAALASASLVSLFRGTPLVTHVMTDPRYSAPWPGYLSASQLGRCAARTGLDLAVSVRHRQQRARAGPLPQAGLPDDVDRDGPAAAGTAEAAALREPRCFPLIHRMTVRWPHISPHQFPHRLVEPFQRQRIHPTAHHLVQHADRLRVSLTLRRRVEPDAGRISTHHALHPQLPWLLVVMLDRAARCHNLVRRHRGVANKNHFVVVRISVQHVPCRRRLVPAPLYSLSTLARRDSCGSRNAPCA